MAAIIISEINGWRANFSRRTLLVLMAVTAICGSLAFLRPEYCLVILTGVFIWIGLVAGKQSWSEAKIDGWAIEGKKAPGLVFSGKLTAVLLITLIHFVVLLPALILTNAIWGIPWWILGETLVSYALTTVLMAALGMLGTLSFGDISEFPRKLFSALFLAVTCIPGLWDSNPVWQVWNLVTSKSPGGMVQFIPNLIVIVLLALVAQFCFPREAVEGG
ncbi:MAG: hypothetical protein K6U80_10545 [Firmicutes bacterium]|nr:hypothetical protein [Bacillota bacterium]